ncbi:hypothetical protein P7C70_g7727, partial [Phenoliferia sp. Uapishka_3]
MPNSTAPTQRACLSTLPVEVKAKIVEMAYLQERGLEERAGKASLVGHISSLSSLALTNREFRGLAAKHQFKVLLSSQRVEHTTFRFFILPDHSHRITHVVLSGVDGILSQTVSILAQLPALRGLQFNLDTAEYLFGPLDGSLEFTALDEESIKTYHLCALKRVAPRIHFLSLKYFTSTSAATLIPCFPNLRTLSIDEVSTTPGDDLHQLSDALVSLRFLTHLGIETDSPIHLSQTFLATLRAHPPPIRCLQIYFGSLSQPLLELISIFGPTLVTLDIRMLTGEGDPKAIPTNTRLILPFLSNLILGEYGDRTTQVFSLFAGTKLRQLAYCGNQSTPQFDQPDIMEFVASQTNLETLRLGCTPRLEFFGATSLSAETYDLPSPTSLAAYSDLVHSRDLDTSVFDEDFLSPFHPKAKLGYTRDKMSFVSRTLFRTLEFGKNEVERMVAEGNIAKAVGWFGILNGLENERAAWRD